MLQPTNEGPCDITLLPLQSIVAFKDSTSSQGLQNSNPQTVRRVCASPARLCLSSQSLWSGNTKFLIVLHVMKNISYWFKQSKEIYGE